MRTWRTFEVAYARMRFWVGLVLSLVIILAGMGAGAFLIWLWSLL